MKEVEFDEELIVAGLSKHQEAQLTEYCCHSVVKVDTGNTRGVSLSTANTT